MPRFDPHAWVSYNPPPQAVGDMVGPPSHLARVELPDPRASCYSEAPSRSTPEPEQIVGCVCNTPESIHECLCYLYNDASNHPRPRYQVSIVYGSGSGQVCIGDELELADPATNKVRKKRWWERHKGTENQLRLPFPRYQRVKFYRITVEPHTCSFSLNIKFKTDDGELETVLSYCTSEGLLDQSPTSIKAIKLHPTRTRRSTQSRPFCRVNLRCETPQTGLFSQRGPQPQAAQISREQCRILADEAIRAGLCITTDGSVFNRETFTRVGAEFNLYQQVALREQRGEFCMLNGERLYFCCPVNLEYRLGDCEFGVS